VRTPSYRCALLGVASSIPLETAPPPCSPSCGPALHLDRSVPEWQSASPMASTRLWNPILGVKLVVIFHRRANHGGSCRRESLTTPKGPRGRSAPPAPERLGASQLILWLAVLVAGRLIRVFRLRFLARVSKSPNPTPFRYGRMRIVRPPPISAVSSGNPGDPRSCLSF